MVVFFFWIGLKMRWTYTSHSIAKAGKKKGYSFDKDELADALNEMNQVGEFFDVELNDAAMASLMSNPINYQSKQGC